MTFVNKHETRKMFLDFIEEPTDSPRRSEVNTSIHIDYLIDHKNIKLQVILLDNRFSFDRIKNDRLGEHQWEWLDIKLASKVNFTIILAGV